MGADAPRLADALSGAAPIVRVTDMPNAVRQASAQARSGEAVLLSPACASFDMFSNYEDRGRAFCAAVEELSAWPSSRLGGERFRGSGCPSRHVWSGCSWR